MAKTFSNAAIQNIFAHSRCCGVLDLLAPAHVVIVVPKNGDAQALRRALASSLASQRGGARNCGQADEVPASSPAHGKTAIGGKATAYVCIGPQCSVPVTEPAALIETVKPRGRFPLSVF